MVTLRAKQRKDLKWEFISQKGNKIDTVGYCKDHDGHTTATEAERCYYKYMIEHADESHMGLHQPCQFPECPLLTDTQVSLFHGPSVWVCSIHKGPDSLSYLVPFMAGFRIVLDHHALTI